MDHLAKEKCFAQWTDNSGQRWLAYIYMGNDLLLKLTGKEESIVCVTPLFW